MRKIPGSRGMGFFTALVVAIVAVTRSAVLAYIAIMELRRLSRVGCT
jgi:hypothetical protein